MKALSGKIPAAPFLFDYLITKGKEANLVTKTERALEQVARKALREVSDAFLTKLLIRHVWCSLNLLSLPALILEEFMCRYARLRRNQQSTR
jgi:hypothetical protein